MFFNVYNTFPTKRLYRWVTTKKISDELTFLHLLAMAIMPHILVCMIIFIYDQTGISLLLLTFSGTMMDYFTGYVTFVESDK